MPRYAVVGASRGIGLEIVRQLAANPDNRVFATARNVEKSVHLVKVADEAPHKNIVLLQADVVDHQSLKSAAEKVSQMTGGSLDILVHNAVKKDYANGNLYRSLTEYSAMDALDTDFIEAFKANALGAIHTVDAFLPLLRKGTAKKIVFISTSLGERGFVWKARITEMAAYSVTKAAKHMIMTKYAAALEEEGFVVAAVNPGGVDSSDTAKAPPTAEEQASLKGVMDKIKYVLPNHSDKPSTPQQAVEKVLATIHSLKPEDTATYRIATLS